MTARQKLVTYLVVVPFAIVLGFPFFFALVTMFKTNLDLANVEHSPYLYNDLEGISTGTSGTTRRRSTSRSSSSRRITRRGS